MKAKELKLILCEDWFIYMYHPDTKQCYYYNTECMLEWGDLPENADQEENAIEKYMLPFIMKENRGLKLIPDCYFDEAKQEIIFTDGK